MKYLDGIKRRIKLKAIIKYAAIVLIALVLLTVIADRLLFPLPKHKLTRAHSYFIYDREDRLLGCYASQDYFWRKPVKLEEISPELIETVLEVEDRRFYYHPGFDPIAIIGATIDNLKAGEIKRGGSTINMQIARMMEPRQRTFGAKLIEIFRALQLEFHYSKDELLEIYFNLVPYGGNLEGVGAASHFYFGKDADNLTSSEAAILTAIPSSPNNYRPDINPEKCIKRRNAILHLLHSHGKIESNELKYALQEEIPDGRIDRPQMAPHLCQTLISDYKSKSELKTTIDLEYQQTCERISGSYLPSLKSRNINNLSIVVLDNAGGKLLAMIGSGDFNDIENEGQINGALARRSPGSTLKPFVYALAFQMGMVTPAYMLADIPVNYDGYSPVNYDETYHGLVTVREALIRSLNVPVVNLVAEMGPEEFYDFLLEGGITSFDHEYHHYGLPLVLGAAEVRLLELSNLYSTLAREGYYRPVKMLADDTSTHFKQILSAEACFLVTNILSNLTRPVLSRVWDETSERPTIAWKTGTSYGHKDAWAIGYNPQFTVGVWCGNFDAEGSPYLVGAEAAAPIMFAVFDELTRGREFHWFEKPSGIASRRVCARSGRPATQYSPSIREDHYIRGVSNNRPCDIFRPILVDRQSGYRLSRLCASGRDIDTVVIEQWPSRIADWLMMRGQIDPIPELAPFCMEVVENYEPVIVSPEADAVFEIRAGVPLEFQKILFEASSSADSDTLHWFLNDQLYASCALENKIFYTPQKGYHTLMCVDEYGRSSTIRFRIE